MTMGKEEAAAVLETYDLSDDNPDEEFKLAVKMAIKALRQKERFEYKKVKANGKYSRYIVKKGATVIVDNASQTIIVPHATVTAGYAKKIGIRLEE